MMDFKVIWSIAQKHLWSRKKQSLVAALGVTFGIGTYIIMMSFMTGLNGLLDGLVMNRTPHVRIYNEIKASPVQVIDQKFKDSALNVVHSIRPKQSLERVKNALAIMDQLKKMPEVKGVTPKSAAKVFYIAGSIELNGLLNGIHPVEEKNLFNFGDYIVKGSVEALQRNLNGILLGAGLAKKMSVNMGDNIQITAPNGSIFNLKVVGIYQSGLAEVDDIQSFVNISTVQQILGRGNDYITDINVKLHDMSVAKAASDYYERLFKVNAIDIKTANAQFDTGTSIRNLISYAVSITLLIVAGFGIYNILNMLIYEKLNDIAILKATGFSGKDVMYIFITQALMIGLIGGIMGLIFGYSISVLIDYTPFETEALPTIKTFPVNYNPFFYIGGIAFAMVSTFLAGYLPAKKAKRIDPVEIIRGQ